MTAISADQNPIRVGITIGDINGIGPEIIIKALNNSEILIGCTPIIYGSSKVLSHYKKLINDEDFIFQGIDNAEEATQKKINVVHCWKEIADIQTGESNQTGGKYAFLALERATEDLASGKIDVLVTAPISKEAMHLAGFEFPGHTEYLAKTANKDEALMVMSADDLRVALVTSHIPLNEVPKAITVEKLTQKIIEFNNSLKKDFGVIRPKIAVLGLNPHAGEKGDIGVEETEIINPTIQKARNQGLLVFGAYPADGFFGNKQYKQFDGVLAMYHDQGLTGFKAIAFNEGVNFTAGLPIVRTSPDHGTAFDIAGKGIADEQSMRNAIYLAMDVYRTRKFIKEMSANPLKK